MPDRSQRRLSIWSQRLMRPSGFLRFSPAGRRPAAFHCEATASRRRGGILGAIHGLGKPAGGEVARWETSDLGDASVGLDAGFPAHFRPAPFFIALELSPRFRRS